MIIFRDVTETLSMSSSPQNLKGKGWNHEEVKLLSDRFCFSSLSQFRTTMIHISCKWIRTKDGTQESEKQNTCVLQSTNNLDENLDLPVVCPKPLLLWFILFLGSFLRLSVQVFPFLLWYILSRASCNRFTTGGRFCPPAKNKFFSSNVWRI